MTKQKDEIVQTHIFAQQWNIFLYFNSNVFKWI